jgi:hypothetical protein
MLVCTMLKHLSENAEKNLRYKKTERLSSLHLQDGRASTKQDYECTLQDVQALHLEAAEWFDKRHYLFASYVFLEKGFRQFGVTTSNACESLNNAIMCCLSNIWLYLTSVVKSMHIYINNLLLGEPNGCVLRKGYQNLH